MEPLAYKDRLKTSMSKDEKEIVRGHFIEYATGANLVVDIINVEKPFVLNFVAWLCNKDPLWYQLGSLDAFYKAKLGRSMANTIVFEHLKASVWHKLWFGRTFKG